MTIQLDETLEKFLNEQVKAGRYASTSEALAAGVARLMLDPEPDPLDEGELARIRESIEQIRRGEVIDADVLHQRLRNKFLSQ